MDADALRLWNRIEAWPLSAPDDPLAFEARLADVEGWTLGHAIAVTREYRRFLMLTQVQSGGAPPRPVEPVSPSVDVDTAWHLHITRTSDYERFCFEVFGRFLHHDPSRGGPDELARHRQMYARTLDVYRDVFDEDPPPAAWPGVDERFAPPARREATEPAVRADLLARVLLLLGGLAIAGALALACSATGVLAPLRAIPGPLFALACLVMLVGIALVGLVPAAAGPGPRPLGRDSVDDYELAWLVGGARRMAATAVVALVDAGRVRLVPATTPARRPGRRAAPAPTRIVAEAAFALDTPPRYPTERRILEAAMSRAIDFPTACAVVVPEASRVGHRLLLAGLARDRGLLESRRLTSFVLALLLLAIVLERLAHAIEIQRPVGFLVVLLALHVLLALTLLLQRSRLTARGRALLRWMRRTVPKPGSPKKGAAARAPAVARGVAAFDARGAIRDPGSAPMAAGGGAATSARTRLALPPIATPQRAAMRANDAWITVPTLVALFGAPAVMADPRFAGIEHAIGREGLATGGDSGGSGCSGGGGGCGGCGGS